MYHKKDILDYTEGFHPEELPPSDDKRPTISPEALAQLQSPFSRNGWKSDIGLIQAYKLLKLSIDWHKSICRHENRRRSEQQRKNSVAACIEPDVVAARTEAILQDRERRIQIQEQILDERAKAMDEMMLLVQRFLSNSETGIVNHLRAVLTSALKDIEEIDKQLRPSEDHTIPVWKID